MTDFNLPSRKTIRLQNWNYAWQALYFVTITTKFGVPYFGKIEDGTIQLNDIGKEVEKQWLQTPTIRPEMNLLLDEYVIMPNHFHGIIGIGKNEYNSMAGHAGGTFGPQIKNLGSTIRGFKSSVTKWCKSQQLEFGWHSRYYDIIIRDEKMLNKVRKYIRNNPENWNKDRFNIT